VGAVHKCAKEANSLRALTTDTTGKLHVLGHDGDTLGVDGAQVSVLKEANKVSFSRLLKSKHSRTLEAQVSLEILSDFTDKTLEWQLADQKLSALLVSADLTKCNGTRAVTMGLLDTASGGGALARGLGRQMLTWGFATGALASGLFSTGHFKSQKKTIKNISKRISD
jgi:hypothetical protein